MLTGMFHVRLLGIFLWALVVSVIGLIACLIFPRHANLLTYWVRALGWGVLKCAGIRIQLEGAEYFYAEGPMLYLINHQSAFDIPVFGSISPLRTTVVGKAEVKFIPVVGQFFWLAGAFLINRKDRAQSIRELNKAVEKIHRKKLNLAMAPEGTRNPDSLTLLPFKKGPFYLAIQAQIPIIPTLCSYQSPLVSFEKKRFRSGTLVVRALKPIPTKGLTESSVNELLEKTHQLMVNAYVEISQSAATSL